MTLRSQLIDFLKQEHGEIHSGQLERAEFKRRQGGIFKPASISRQARLLAEEGIIQKRYEKGSVIYWYEQSNYEKMDSAMKEGKVEIGVNEEGNRQVRLEL